MYDARCIDEWHRQFLPFLCSACGRRSRYSVEEPSVTTSLTEPHARDRATPVLFLRCDACGELTRFPRARLEHFDQIREAARSAVVRHLAIRLCPKCAGRGIVERREVFVNAAPRVLSPCPACLGPGFVWAPAFTGETKTFLDVLAG
jgi:sulfur relay (sulfurtransferase) complex TusBCD TusD component (DsrE family)